MNISNPSELKFNQVALLRVDPDTGVPVNDAGDWVETGKELYLKFDSELEAREYTRLALEKDPMLEWSLIDSDGNQLDVLHCKEHLIKARKSDKRTFFDKWFGWLCWFG